jgi:ATP-dependent Clp protease ATP-binding subunit ClpC
MFGKFTEESQKVLVNAKKEMMELQHPYVGSEHLLLAILKEDNSISRKLKEFNVDYKIFRDELVRIMGMGSIKSQWFLYTPLLKRIIENAIIDSKESNDEEVTIEHLFSALLEEGEGVAIRILLSMKVDVDKLYSNFSRKLIGRKMKKKNLLIEEMAVNLNKKAIDKELDPIVGRDNEIKEFSKYYVEEQKIIPY